MKSPFCRNPLVGKTPISCPSCRAGDFGGLTEGQFEVLKTKLRSAKRDSSFFWFAGAVIMTPGILSIIYEWELWITVSSFVVGIIFLVIGFRELLESRDLEWMLTWWKKKGE